MRKYGTITKERPGHRSKFVPAKKDPALPIRYPKPGEIWCLETPSAFWFGIYEARDLNACTTPLYRAYKEHFKYGSVELIEFVGLIADECWSWYYKRGHLTYIGRL